jgi:hypothetical protein
MMANSVFDAFEAIVLHKAKNLDGGNRAHGSRLLKELHIDRLEDAFIIGCIDAMIFDVGCCTHLKRFYPPRKKRVDLINKYWKEKRGIKGDASGKKMLR